MTKPFLFIGNSVTDSTGLLPYFDSAGWDTNRNYTHFDSSHFPHTRSELQGQTEDAWTSWKMLTDYAPEDAADGKGLLKNGAEGFYARIPYRWVNNPNNSRMTKFQLSKRASADPEWLLYTIMLPISNHAPKNEFYPLKLPPGALRFRWTCSSGTSSGEAAALHIDPRLDPGPDNLGGYSQYSVLGFDSNDAVAKGTYVASSATAQTWGAWVEIGTTSHRWKLMRTLRQSNGADGNNKACIVQTGVGVSGDIDILSEVFIFTDGSENSYNEVGWRHVDIPQDQKIWARIYGTNNETWTVDSLIMVEGVG